VKYTFYEDPGHGWLRVPLAELAELGIEGAITPYSYQDNEFAYLEEDCDAAAFIAAKAWGARPKACYEVYKDWDPEKATAWGKDNVTINDRATLRGAPTIFIRSLPSYKPKPSGWGMAGGQVDLFH